MLLAGLTRIGPRERVIDLGTGCGVVPLVFAYRRKEGPRIVGIEIQPELARLARKNVDENGLGNLVDIQEMDFREVPSRFAPESFDLVVSNPPYRKPGTGRVNPNRQKAVARHELSATLPDVFSAAHHLLRRGGRIGLIYPASRTGHLFSSASERGFSPKTLRIVHSYPNGPGRLVYLLCTKGGGEEVRVEPPFFIYRQEGGYTDAMRKLYEE